MELSRVLKSVVVSARGQVNHFCLSNDRIGRTQTIFNLITSTTKPCTRNYCDIPRNDRKNRVCLKKIEYSLSKMIEQKSHSLPKDEAAQMADLTMTKSSSFTHLSMDTDEFSRNGDERATNNHTSNQSTTSYSFAMYDALADICQNNVKYFECDDSETGQRFLCAFRGIIDHIAISQQFVGKIITFMHEYDFDENTPANGYRSFVKATHSCINHTVKISKYIAQNRSYLLFRKNMYMK